MLRAAGKCAELEERWAPLTEAKHAMTCANGTCALQLAYEPLIRPGDEVLVPAWSYIATVSMVVARGATPVFVDAHPDRRVLILGSAAPELLRQSSETLAGRIAFVAWQAGGMDI